MTKVPVFDAVILKEELNQAELVLTWNQRIFALFGMNPLNFNNFLYILVFFYSIIHFTLSCADLPNNFNDLNSLIDAVTEVGSMSTVLIKLALYKFKSSSLSKLMIEMSADYEIEKYKNEIDVYTFVDYVTRAKIFFKVAIPMSFAAAVMYYTRIFTIIGFGLPHKTDSLNVTIFVLPYRMIFYYPLTDFYMYLGALIYLLPVIPITAFGLVADASLMLALLAHVCGQLSVLSRSVIKYFPDEKKEFRKKVAKDIMEHNRLIKMAKDIDSTFNLLMLQQILSVTFFLCFVGYSTLLHWNQRQNAQMLTFLTCGSLTIFLLFAYCYAGQCLIDESVYLSDALYHSPWYNLDPLDIKYYLLFLKRAQDPLRVTGGGFYIYSLSSFVAVLKSAMAYMSVLRTLI